MIVLSRLDTQYNDIYHQVYFCWVSFYDCLSTKLRMIILTQLYSIQCRALLCWMSFYDCFKHKTFYSHFKRPWHSAYQHWVLSVVMLSVFLWIFLSTKLLMIILIRQNTQHWVSKCYVSFHDCLKHETFNDHSKLPQHSATSRCLVSYYECF